MSVTQLFRPAGFHCTLPEGTLALTAMSGEEQLSRPYRFTVELVSDDHDLNLDDLIGQPGCVRLAFGAGKGGSRYFHGLISRFRQLPAMDRFARYQAELVPWLWLLTRTSDCRIFQNLTVPQILEEVFRKHGFTDYKLRLSASYQPKEYCVQYRETDFNFVSRLMEHEGIAYFFEHADDRHYLILADAAAAYGTTPGYEKIDWNPHTADNSVTQKIRDWLVEKELQTGTYAQRDFDYLRPKVDLTTLAVLPRPHALNNLEIYDYPGDYIQHEVGEHYTQIRIEELQTRYETITGQSDARGITAGYVFALAKYPRTDQNREYLATSVQHRLSMAEYASGAQTAAGTRLYECSFTVMDATQPFRPARSTPKPMVQGPQTATVVGPKGQEIHVDDHARVKVHFHWDRHDKQDENSSCWIRVSQPWAGKGFGCMNIPRIGQEVIVEFLEGDPDRPIINGRVYNGGSMPHASNSGRDGKPGNSKPSGVSAAAMMTSFKSNSLGGSGGHNEITMNDTGGAEGLFIKAQKDEIHNVGNDRERTVGNNESVKVGNDRTKDVGNDETTTIAANRTETVGGNETITIKGNRTDTVQMNEIHTVNICRSQTVMMAENNLTGVAKSIETGVAHIEAIGLMKAEAIGLMRFTLVGMDDTLVVGHDLTVKPSGTESHKAGKDFIVESGNNLGLKAAKMLVIECPDITLKSAGGFIRIDASGVTIQGTKVKVNSGGSAGALSAPATAAPPADKKGGASGGAGGAGGAASGSSGGAAAGAGGAAPAAPPSPMSAALQKLGIPANTADVLGKLANGDMPSMDTVTAALPSLKDVISKVPSKYLPDSVKSVLGTAAAIATGTPEEAEAAEKELAKKAADDLKKRAEDKINFALGIKEKKPDASKSSDATQPTTQPGKDKGIPGAGTTNPTTQGYGKANPGSLPPVLVKNQDKNRDVPPSSKA